MSAFPVAPTAEAALHAPLGAAARESEARALAGGEVVLVTEAVGPAFAAREAAADAYGDRLEQPGCALRPVAPEGVAPPPPARALTGGPARWPAPVAPAAVLWQLQVSYWRTTAQEAAEPPPAPEPLASARRARRDAGAASLDARALGRLAAQPLRPVRPQQPLDIGLFEARAPDQPDLILPDD